jgi:hypothetical protein
MEGHCLCLKKQLMICNDVVDQELLDFSTVILQQFKDVIVSSEMECEDVNKLEMRSGLKVVNKDCEGAGLIKDPQPLTPHTRDNVEDTLNGIDIGHYVYEVFTFFLVFISLLLAAKLKHNMAPVIDRLPRDYISNLTFIRNMFKVFIQVFNIIPHV